MEQEQTPAAAIQAMNRVLEADPYLRATGQVNGRMVAPEATICLLCRCEASNCKPRPGTNTVLLCGT